MTPSSSRSDTLDPAARERNDLAEAFARVLLSEGPIAAQAPVFFQEPDGTMIWANDGYYALAAPAGELVGGAAPAPSEPGRRAR